MRLLLVGKPDNENPGAISHEEIEEWAKEPDVEWLGYCTDIRSVWAQADIAVLPSTGGEGLPKALLEAAACGRPLIATDVPGSREIAIDGRNAIVVPPSDPDALCDALERLAEQREIFAKGWVKRAAVLSSRTWRKSTCPETSCFYTNKMIERCRARSAAVAFVTPEDPRRSRDHGLRRGGAETMLAKLLEVMDAAEFRQTVVVLQDKGALGARIEQAGVPVIPLNMKSPLDLPRLFCSCRSFLKKSKAPPRPDLALPRRLRRNASRPKRRAALG